jgi:hypothetical protein
VGAVLLPEALRTLALAAGSSLGRELGGRELGGRELGGTAGTRDSAATGGPLLIRVQQVGIAAI